MGDEKLLPQVGDEIEIAFVGDGATDVTDDGWRRVLLGRVLRLTSDSESYIAGYYSPRSWIALYDEKHRVSNEGCAWRWPADRHPPIATVNLYPPSANMTEAERVAIEARDAREERRWHMTDEKRAASKDAFGKLLEYWQVPLRDEVPPPPRADEMTDKLAALIAVRAKAAAVRYGPFASAHEAHSVIREELEELFDEVRKKRALRSQMALRDEALDIATAALRYAAQIETRITYEDEQLVYSCEHADRLRSALPCEDEP